MPEKKDIFKITDEGSGLLRLNVTDAFTNKPIRDAYVSISLPGSPDETLYSLRTDENGQTETVPLTAPPKLYSETPQDDFIPYSTCNVLVSAYSYQTVSVTGCEIFDTETSVLPVKLKNLDSNEATEFIEIPANTLWGDYPEKFPEEEVKPISSSGEIVLDKVIIPEYIIVHDGAPNNAAAKDYYVPYADYIKNVACSEIYSTWPYETLKANIIAIMSFTLNRVYSEWYRGRGYYFTITSLPAYDQKWTYGRNYFESISKVVDEVFNCYVSKPNLKQPLFTQYCDGQIKPCQVGMSQWGSKQLGENGYTASEILEYYYGSTAYINTAEEVEGLPISWNGKDLDIGSSGEDVRIVQRQLNVIGDSYYGIEKLATDGIYGERTRNAVIRFQEIFDMPQTGVVNYAVWYKISSIYVALTGISRND